MASRKPRSSFMGLSVGRRPDLLDDPCYRLRPPVPPVVPARGCPLASAHAGGTIGRHGWLGKAGGSCPIRRGNALILLSAAPGVSPCPESSSSRTKKTTATCCRGG